MKKVFIVCFKNGHTAYVFEEDGDGEFMDEVAAFFADPDAAFRAVRPVWVSKSKRTLIDLGEVVSIVTEERE